MIPYTYLLHHKPTDTWYYGVKWAKGCHPDQFWKSYFTSSHQIQLLRTLFGNESFEFEIRRTFKTGKAASDWESKVLKRMKVLQKPNQWINRTTNSAWLYDVHPMSGKERNDSKKLMNERNPNNNPLVKEKLKNYARVRKWITDGKVNKHISSNQNLPEGYQFGRTLTYSSELIQLRSFNARLQKHKRDKKGQFIL